MTFIKDIKNIPCCISLATILTIVYSLYVVNVIKTLPCDKLLLSRFKSNFFHNNYEHLLQNLFSLYAISRLEVELGTKNFFTLFIFCLIINSIIETFLFNKFKIKCGIGFSGILYSLTFWDIFMTDEIDYYLVTASLFSFIRPFIQKEDNVSITGHFIGICSGVFSAILFKFFKPYINF